MKFEVHIKKEGCKGCRICAELCQAGVLEMSGEINSRGCHFPQVKEPDKCTNCGLCQMFCPDFAIWVSPKEERVSA